MKNEMRMIEEMINRVNGHPPTLLETPATLNHSENAGLRLQVATYSPHRKNNTHSWTATL